MRKEEGGVREGNCMGNDEAGFWFFVQSVCVHSNIKYCDEHFIIVIGGISTILTGNLNPVSSKVHITANVVSSNPTQARCTRYNNMWSSLSLTCGRSVFFSGYCGFLHQENWKIMLYRVHLASAGFELTTLAVICTLGLDHYYYGNFNTNIFKHFFR
jgi:hypothetical protein